MKKFIPLIVMEDFTVPSPSASYISPVTVLSVDTAVTNSIFPGHMEAEGNVTSPVAIRKSTHAVLLNPDTRALEAPAKVVPLFTPKARPVIVTSSL